ncbi:MAG: glycosyltransferase family 4 protein [Cellulomonas sp.]|nr:glycosyltransferase family 4 protein [Cellulomonas sp.]
MPLDPQDVRNALAGRLRAAAAVALDEIPDPAVAPDADTAQLLDAWADHITSTGGAPSAWLLLVAVTGRFPVDEEVHALRRLLVAEPRHRALGWLLDQGLAAFSWNDPLAELDLKVGEVVVDVDFTARHDLNTGIQRVVRQLGPRWSDRPGLTWVAWSPGGAMRHLGEVETGRVRRWAGRVGEPPAFITPRRVVVPWRSVVVLPEVPAETLCPVLATLAEHSGNSVSLIGYDAIPVVSADLMPPAEPERFVHYLTVVKHARAVSAISRAVAEEFGGFVDMLPAQGLTGPHVTSCPLPVDVPPAPTTTLTTQADPQVLVVGSHEPRKNHLAVLHAAELLWRDGLRFGLTFVGGPSWQSRGFDKAVAAAARRGRDVQILRKVADGELLARYRAARLTVFPSVHEGYGLPVAESLAVGTPVVSSDVGSMAEIAADGGVIAVDPRDDEALAAAIRTLLLDDEAHARLRAEGLARPPRTWDDYARELWEQLVDDVRDVRA